MLGTSSSEPRGWCRVQPHMLQWPAAATPVHPLSHLWVLVAAAAAGAMPSIHPCSMAALDAARRCASEMARGHCRLGLWARCRGGEWEGRGEPASCTHSNCGKHAVRTVQCRPLLPDDHSACQSTLSLRPRPLSVHTCRAQPPGC